MEEIKELAEAIRSLILDGEAKIEVSMRLVRDGTDTRTERKPRPYDPEGRLSGYRQIAGWLETSVGFVIGKVKSGAIPVYKDGRHVYAYTDEIMMSLASEHGTSPKVRKIFSDKGCVVKTVAAV